MKFIVVENQTNGVIHKHTYSEFASVRNFCKDQFPQEYVPHMSMATVVSLLENHSCEFTIKRDKNEMVEFI